MPDANTTADNCDADASPFREVLIPIDGSGVLLERLEAVAPILAWTEATLHVLHVIPPGAPAREQGEDDRETDAERLVAETTDRLVEHGFSVESHLAEGMPEDQIVRKTEALDADLIVMVTRGGGLLNPSITRMVIQAVDVPVMAVGA